MRYFHPGDELQIPIGMRLWSVELKRLRMPAIMKICQNFSNSFSIQLLDIQIYNNDENPKIPFVPKDTIGLVKVFWQHYGLEDNNLSNIYKSIRTNRYDENSNSSLLCYTELNDVEFQNCEIQFDLKLRTEFLNNESFFVIGFKGKNFQDEKTDTVFANGIYDASVKLSVEKMHHP